MSILSVVVKSSGCGSELNICVLKIYLCIYKIVYVSNKQKNKEICDFIVTSSVHDYGLFIVM